MIIFKKEYDGESLYDVGRDIDEAFNAAYNYLMDDIPQDKDGFTKGTFTVTIEWKE